MQLRDEFQLFQGGERVYRARVQEARLELPGRWRQDGRPHALLPGSYRWYVWMISKRTKAAVGQADRERETAWSPSRPG